MVYRQKVSKGVGTCEAISNVGYDLPFRESVPRALLANK